jgi:hypothetical protein
MPITKEVKVGWTPAVDEEKSPYSGEFNGRNLKSATTNHTSINFGVSPGRGPTRWLSTWGLSSREASSETSSLYRDNSIFEMTTAPSLSSPHRAGALC